MAKDPAMPFYVNDYLSSPKVAMMNAEQERAYLRLMLYCWASGDASLPDDNDALAGLSRMGEVWFTNGSRLVRDCFEKHPTKKKFLTHHKIYALWQERQEWREKSRLAGIKSGKTRAKHTKGGSRESQPNHQPKGNSSSSSSSSSSSISIPLPPILDTPEFREALADWRAYRGAAYKTRGEKAMLTKAAKRAESHGVQAVINAFETAQANGWQGWDFDSSFDARSSQKSPAKHLTAQQYQPGSEVSDGF